ncbi:MAG: division/cell wall cluster transcriptional repressor MraZ [Candidatus Tagabacteria bacterium CG_4_10_14_0_2_um_filter_40_13]|uniref:Transcriptional regulator MraZ n=2 Tax=Candidatus Tagaibacteriota TaxID=1817918 RepID=A0A2M7B9T8_9BACT|nr:MAG: division/cell wall cluster transcriptional repressor MraZ [Candidatus Tagabacteria bacterium CG03_land_8_20_14_0_80_41_22]PIZ56033.1 MAG: division/cell wall cluster transcriptional repressor MraZ [Candidatus Tagabacteria bacterium CG_4_10_14_0_2_um_filter_40_13]PJC25238.1 MAG: division/cell wall cluster transcriptional repressor MraZ [Candidatus Tagabacteria bacterium CG_4_9_14_0_2_um_filter_41_11]
MLIGEHIHRIDPKKRLAIPARFRKELGEKVVITKGLDQCLVLYPLTEWEKVAEELSKLPTGKSENRNFVRDFFSKATDVELDVLGRILIPEYLKTLADLKEKVVIVGIYKRLEIWNEEKWNDYKTRVEKQTDVLAEKLGELGVY